MSRWRDLARLLKEQEGVRDDRDNRDDIASATYFVPIVPNVPVGVSRSRSLTDPTEWGQMLAALDSSRAPTGIAADWWQRVLADARWLARNHGDAAAAFGWSASDLFGIEPHLGPLNGGLADRLDGARCLAVTARLAHWRGDNCEGWLWRRTLTDKSALWELSGPIRECRANVEGRA